MSRTLSTAADAAIFAAQTTESVLRLIVIDHEDWDEPFRLVNNTNDVVSNGDTYTACPFKIEPPNDTGNELSRVTLLLDNVNRTFLPSFRAAQTKPTVTFFLVLASDPDTIIGDTWDFEVSDISYNAQVIQANLLFDSINDVAVPGDDMGPNKNPGLFKEGE